MLSASAYITAVGKTKKTVVGTVMYGQYVKYGRQRPKCATSMCLDLRGLVSQSQVTIDGEARSRC
jgi:hypothetical protein